MTENEKELVEMIRNSNDPAKAMMAAIDVIREFLADQRCRTEHPDLKNKAV